MEKTLKPRESQGHIKVTEKQSVGWRSWFGVTYRQSFVVAKYVTLSHSLNVVVLLSDISMYPKFREFMILSQPLDLRVQGLYSCVTIPTLGLALNVQIFNWKGHSIAQCLYNM